MTDLLRYRIAVALCVAAGLAVAVAALAPSLWTRNAVRQIAERQLRLRRLADTLILHGSRHEGYPAAATCRDVQAAIAPSATGTLTCDDPGGGHIRYVAVLDERQVVRFAFISPGADEAIDEETRALVTAAELGPQAFEDAERRLAASAAGRTWDDFIDGDIVITDAGFTAGAAGLGPLIPSPQRVRVRFWTWGGGAAALLIAAAVAVRRGGRRATGRDE